MPMPIPMLIFTPTLIIVVIFAVLTCSFVAVVVLDGLDVEKSLEEKKLTEAWPRNYGASDSGRVVIGLLRFLDKLAVE